MLYLDSKMKNEIKTAVLVKVENHNDGLYTLTFKLAEGTRMSQYNFGQLTEGEKGIMSFGDENGMGWIVVNEPLLTMNLLEVNDAITTDKTGEAIIAEVHGKETLAILVAPKSTLVEAFCEKNGLRR